MEIEGKAILTSDDQLREVKELVRANFKENASYLYESSDTYWEIGENLVRIRRLSQRDTELGGSTVSSHFITIKNKTKNNGIEINEEKEYSIEPSLLSQIIFPLLIETSKTAVYTKTKKYTQFGYFEPAERRFYKIDCGYAWAEDFGDRKPYVEIETITAKDESFEAAINCSQMIRGIFKTLKIENLMTDKSWKEILGDK